MDSTLINYFAVQRRRPIFTFVYNGTPYTGDAQAEAKEAQAAVDHEAALAESRGDGVSDLAPLGRALLARDAANARLAAFDVAYQAHYLAANGPARSWQADSAAAWAAVEAAARAAAA